MTVSNENFRRELLSAFDEMAGAPPIGRLRDRVRSAATQAPEPRPASWVAAVAAAVIAVTIVGVFYVANPLNRRSPAGGVVATQSPTPASTPTPESTLPAFTCTSNSLGTNPPQVAVLPVVYITDLKTGSHAGYDRLTITFGTGVPNGGIGITTQAGTDYTASPSGMAMKLKGSNGLLVTLHGSDLHTSYSGSTDIVTGYSTMVEVRRVEDFEGTVQLGIGINGPACYRAFLLTNPNRLVIDVQSGS